MPNFIEFCLLDFNKFGINGCRIKFSIGKLEVFSPGNWVWYLEKQPNFEKRVEI